MINTILITGGCGFIGSHFVNLALKRNFNLINLDPLLIGSNKTFTTISTNKYKFYKVSTTNKSKVREILETNKPNAIINFGAETHVDRSIINPKKFIKNNVLGTFNIVDEFKNYVIRNGISNYKFINISTDEVYGSTNDKSFKETDTLYPNSPYSSSKAAADLVLRSFEKTYNFKSIIVRPSNNFGPRQYHEKLIPLSIKRLNEGKKIPVYGNGRNKREWLYVEDCVKTILNLLNSKLYSGTFNIGSNKTISNIDLINLICNLYFKKKFSKQSLIKNYINFVEDRPGHDFMYKLNHKKIKKLGLLENSNFETNLRKTVNYYKKI